MQKMSTLKEEQEMKTYSEASVRGLLEALENWLAFEKEQISKEGPYCGTRITQLIEQGNEALKEFRLSEAVDRTLDTNTVLIATEDCKDANMVIIPPTSELIAKVVNDDRGLSGDRPEERTIDHGVGGEFSRLNEVLPGLLSYLPKITPQEIENAANDIMRYEMSGPERFKAGTNFILGKLGINK